MALARTMVMKPRILLLDEPLSALDGVIKESIKEKIKEIAREFKLTTIIVTHDPAFLFLPFVSTYVPRGHWREEFPWCFWTIP